MIVDVLCMYVYIYCALLLCLGRVLLLLLLLLAAKVWRKQAKSFWLTAAGGGVLYGAKGGIVV